MNTSLVQNKDYRLERWEHYAPLPWTVCLLIAIVLIIVLIIGAVGNTLVLALFSKYKSLRTSSNIFVVNQAIADLLMCILCLPILIANSLRGHYEPHSEYILCIIMSYMTCLTIYVAVCNIDASVAALTGFVSIWSLVAVAIDRFYVIKKCLPASHTIDKSTTCFILLGIWIFSVIGTVLPFMGVGQYVLEGSNMSCTFDYFTRSYTNIIYNVFIQISFFGVPISLIIFCYASIFVNVRSHERRYFTERNSLHFNEISMRRLRRSRNFERNELKTAKAAIILISVFCLSWMPYSVLSIVALCGNDEGISPIVVTIPVIFAKVSTILNPVLYALVHRRFKSKLVLFIRQYFSAKSYTVRSADRQDQDEGQKCSKRSFIRYSRKNTLATEV